MSMYKCENYSNCANADTGKQIELSSAVEPKCPVCSAPLKSLSGGDAGTSVVTKTAGGKPVTISAAVFAVLLVAGGGYWGYSKMTAPVVLKPDPVASSSAPTIVAAADQKVSAKESVETKQPSGLAPSESDTAALKKAADDALLMNRAADAEASASKAAANELIKSAVAKIAQGKLAEADSDLQLSLKQDPKSYLAYYNLAVIKLRNNSKEDALRYFESSFEAGFPYYDKMEQDEDLASLRNDPRFVSLVAKYRK